MSDFPFAVHSGEEEGRDDREDQSDFKNRFPGLLVDQIRSHSKECTPRGGSVSICPIRYLWRAIGILSRSSSYVSHPAACQYVLLGYYQVSAGNYSKLKSFPSRPHAMLANNYGSYALSSLGNTSGEVHHMP